MPKKETFESWYNDIEDIRDKGILPIKNGLEYKIALTSTKKPLFKKQKSTQFATLRKKYEVTGVNLLGIAIANRKEIDKIISEDSTQETRYHQIENLQIETTYTLKLTEQQWKSLTQFMKTNNIDLNDTFYFQRFGKQLNTFFRFNIKSQIIKKTKKGETK